jgi:hypothetical protein
LRQQVSDSETQSSSCGSLFDDDFWDNESQESGPESGSYKPTLRERWLADRDRFETKIDYDQKRLNGSSIAVNLLHWHFPKGTQVREYLRKGQWPARKYYTKGKYIMPVDRDSYRYMTYTAGLIQSMQDIVNAAVFSKTPTFGPSFENFLRKFLKNVPRKYFFSSEDLRSLRAQIFWTRRFAERRNHLLGETTKLY